MERGIRNGLRKVSRRDFFRCVGAAGAMAVLGGGRARAAKKPNVLFIFADDLSYRGVHALGNDEVRTPNIDRLVARGTSFTHAYNPGAWHGAVCVASRTMLNTGRFLWESRRLEPDLGKEVSGDRFWAQQLAGAGYDTYFAGKWHIKADPKKAFDHVRHVRPGMPSDTKAGYGRPVKGKPDRWSPWDKKFGGFWKGGTHWSEILAQDADAFFDTVKESDNPFFMYLAFNAPHDPRQSPKEYVEGYPTDEIEVPESFLPEYPHNKTIGAGRSLRDESLAPFPRTEYAVQVHRREYYAIIEHMDAQIGKMLDRLEKSGEAENTYVVFSADHGLAVGRHGFMGKQNMYEHSLRAPLIVAGPDLPEGKRIDTPVYIQDVMPTTLEWAGVKPPDYVDFKSLMPLIRNEREEQYEAVYGGYTHLQRMVIEDGWKLIWYPKADVRRLYNLNEDPKELKDLSGEETHAARMKKLAKTLRGLQEAHGDPLEKIGVG